MGNGDTRLRLTQTRLDINIAAEDREMEHIGAGKSFVYPLIVKKMILTMLPSLHMGIVFNEHTCIGKQPAIVRQNYCLQNLGLCMCMLVFLLKNRF